MTGRYVWVVTDQSSNNLALLAFLRHQVRSFGEFELVPIFVDKNRLTHPKAGHVRQQILATQRTRPRHAMRHLDPVLLFRDSECRCELDLTRQTTEVKALGDVLRNTFPNTHELSFNPMSEAAFLLFESALDALCTSENQGELRRLARERRAGRMVNKDQLESALGVASALRKRQVDGDMASLLFGDVPVVCTEPVLVRVVERIQSVLRAALAASPTP